ncbi:MAG: hypothetical protein JKY27_01495 [Magnetovibrio sp.]|nr:hypothetical protein [Magnetovibrio sp.]
MRTIQERTGIARILNLSPQILAFACWLIFTLVYMVPMSVAAADNPSGATAKKNGQTLEMLIETALVNRGFKPVQYSIWSQKPQTYPARVVLKNVPYKTIYEKKGRTEFVLKGPNLGGDIRIEAKWQQASGSLDERLPYLYLNASRFDTMPEAHVVIVIDGSGWRDGAIKWLRNAAQNAPQGKHIEVMDLGQFLAWTNRL